MFFHAEDHWTIKVNRNHRVHFDTTEVFFGHKFIIYVDNNPVVQARIGMFSPKGSEIFYIDNQPFIVNWEWTLGFGTAKPKLIEITSESGEVVAHFDEKNISSQAVPNVPNNVPKWAWIFIGGCFALPVVSLGGLIPGMFGFGGAALCRSTATDTSRSTAINILLCTGITLGAWIATFMIAGGFSVLVSS